MCSLFHSTKSLCLAHFHSVQMYLVFLPLFLALKDLIIFYSLHRESSKTQLEQSAHELETAMGCEQQKSTELDYDVIEQVSSDEEEVLPPSSQHLKENLKDQDTLTSDVAEQAQGEERSRPDQNYTPMSETESNVSVVVVDCTTESRSEEVEPPVDVPPVQTDVVSESLIEKTEEKKPNLQKVVLQMVKRNGQVN